MGEPARHQVEELPVIAVKVSEHRWPSGVRCPGCGAARQRRASTRARRQCISGPGLQAAIATLSVSQPSLAPGARVELGEELFQARLSTGTVEKVLAA